MCRACPPEVVFECVCRWVWEVDVFVLDDGEKVVKAKLSFQAIPVHTDTDGNQLKKEIILCVMIVEHTANETATSLFNPIQNFENVFIQSNK